MLGPGLCFKIFSLAHQNCSFAISYDALTARNLRSINLSLSISISLSFVTAEKYGIKDRYPYGKEKLRASSPPQLIRWRVANRTRKSCAYRMCKEGQLLLHDVDETYVQ